jgi:nucleoid DNA-binding protein
MNKAQLIEKVALKTNLTKNQSESVIDATIEIIQQVVAPGR